MIRRNVLGDPQGNSPESYWPESKEYISSKKWREIVPSSYTNRGWLSTGDSLFDGVGVKDSSDRIASEDMLQASRFLDARSTIIDRMDSNLRRDLWDYHVWYSDSQGTFVADFPRPSHPNTIEENYLEALAILNVLRPVLELPIIRGCPLSKIRDLIEIFDEALIDLKLVASIYGSGGQVGKEGCEDDSWFVSVIIDENGTPGFDVFPAVDLEKARIICGCVADSNGLSADETTVIGPFINRECATVAMNRYQAVPIEEDEESYEYLERLEHISKTDAHSS